MEQILNRIQYIFILCLIIAAFIGGRYSNHTDVVYQQDVKPATHTQTQSPEGQSYDTLFNWALEDIEIDREYNPATGDLKIRAYTSYKESIVYDKIIPSFKKHQYIAGVGITNELSIAYTVGYLHYFNASFGAGGLITASGGRIKNINAIISFNH